MAGNARDDLLRALCYASAAYDLLVAVPLLLFPAALAELFGAPSPQPLVNAHLNGVFTFTLAAGYVWAAERPAVRRGYLWLAGVLAKGMGAFYFVLDGLLRPSPKSFLLFAATDGTLALVTLVLLLRARASARAAV